ncbi:serine hydrolase [Candidatus Saccharibacteria bacterium]|nr:serine hydrolase [Candidatus Saccharibacteria bacterium]
MALSTVIKSLAATLVAAALVGGGFILGHDHQTSTQKPLTSAAPYSLLDPSVSDSATHPEIINFDPLRQNLKLYLAGLNVSHSLYFEYLPNGVNIRDGDDNTSQAASLLKTPLVMDLYKLAEQGKISLDNVSTVNPVDLDADPVYGNPTHLRIGDKLTLRQAAQITLKYSDNTTLSLIKDRIIPIIDSSSDSFRSLDLTLTFGSLATNQQVAISSRSYASILKCLYYACFNSPDDSTQIITDLFGSSELNRLVAGVPTDIKVAHKVGSGSTSAQSDCGIIYDPGKPYLVCLMLFNIPSTTNVNPYFQHVSQMIYDYVNGATPDP